jgi:hypothetical protein
MRHAHSISCLLCSQVVQLVTNITLFVKTQQSHESGIFRVSCFSGEAFVDVAGRQL